MAEPKESMSRDLLSLPLACPRCRLGLTCVGGKLRCPGCDGHVQPEGRVFDFRALTPEIPLHFAGYSRELHEAAGQRMSDVEINWRVRRVLNLVTRAGRGRVCLEIGGADGPMTGHLEAWFDATLTVDFGMSFLRRVEAKTRNAICLCGDAQFLPVMSGTVDVVVCSEVLEHVSAPTQLLLEIRRVLHRRGRCILSVPRQARCDLLGLEREGGRLPATDSHVTFFNGPALKELLYRMGFKVIEFSYLSKPWPLSLSARELLRYLRGKLAPSYLVCLAEPMDEPDAFWRSLESTLGIEGLHGPLR